MRRWRGSSGAADLLEGALDVIALKRHDGAEERSAGCGALWILGGEGDLFEGDAEDVGLRVNGRERVKQVRVPGSLEHRRAEELVRLRVRALAREGLCLVERILNELGEGDRI